MTEKEPIFRNVKPQIVAYGRDPALLYRIKRVLDGPVAGEDSTKLTLTVAATSSRSVKPLGALIGGSSSAGKNWVLDAVLAYFNNVTPLTRMTEASPDRLAQDFTGRILAIKEIVGVEKAQATLRVWISEGKLSLLTTDKDEHGRITTRTIETNGTPTFFTTTSAITVDQDLQNRLLVVSIDESKDQTRKVLRKEAEQFSDLDYQSKPDPDLKAFLNGLMPGLDVVVPYADLLAEIFPADRVTSRRDFKKLLSLVYAIAYLHQFQRPIIQKDLRLVIVATPLDLQYALEIAGDALKNTILGLQQRAVKVLAMFEETPENVTVKDVAERLDTGTDNARKILYELMKHGFILEDDAHKPYKYSLQKQLEAKPLLGDLEAIYQFPLDDWIRKTEAIIREPGLPSEYIHPLIGPSKTTSLEPPSETETSRLANYQQDVSGYSGKQQERVLDGSGQDVVRIDPGLVSDYILHTAIPVEQNVSGYAPIVKLVYHVSDRYGTTATTLIPSLIEQLEKNGQIKPGPFRDTWQVVRRS